MSGLTPVGNNNNTFGFQNLNNYAQSWSPTLKSIARKAAIVSLPLIAAAIVVGNLPTAEAGPATYASCVAGCMAMPIGVFRPVCLAACLPMLAPNLP